MKVFARMLVLLLVAGGFAAALAGSASMAPPPAALTNLAVRPALQSAIAAQWFMGLTNVIFWPILLVGVRLAERFWQRQWPARPSLRFSGLLRWLGLLAAGLWSAVWVSNLYVVLVMAAAPPHLAALVRQLEAQGSVGLVVWILAVIGAAVLTGTPPEEAVQRDVDVAQVTD